MKLTEPDVIVVGAGAAGIFAARSAARRGASVLLLEKTSRIGTKILISGGGKCNIAHFGPLESVIGAFSKPEALFVRPSCYHMTNEQIMGVFKGAGIELKVRADGRVFPATGTAKDVLNVLIDELQKDSIRVCLDTSVEQLRVANGWICGVDVRIVTPRVLESGYPQEPTGFGAKALLREALRKTSHRGEPWDGPQTIDCQHVIVCPGGSSYPNSGTSGDGWKWMRDLGHTVVKPRAALAPIYLETPFTDLSGVSLSNCGLAARFERKKAAKRAGDLLFTHQGLSGPVVLGMSREVALLRERGPVELELDFFPAESEAHLSSCLLSTLDTRLTSLLSIPQSVAEMFWSSLKLDPKKTVRNLSTKDRNLLIARLKGWPIGFVRSVPLEKGEVTAGGVSLEEVDSKTMRSKLVGGLYLAGEILDIAGPVGGYNLQAAFATGHVAGETAALDRLAHS